MSESRTEHRATEANPFHFADSGLQNIYLVGIRYFIYQSGRVVPEIPAIKQLMQLIARDLIFKETALSGDEIRFIRKRLGQKQIDFASVLSVTPECLCRWENGSHAPSESNDKLIRMYYALAAVDDAHLNELRDKIGAFLSHWKQAVEHGVEKKMVAKVTNDEWVLTAA